jgi:hypothetical protein
MSDVDFTQLAKELHRGIVRKFPRRKVYAPGVNNTWSCDLIDYLSLKKYNEGYAYILICVDVFSKFVRAVPLKDKSALTVLRAFHTFDTLPQKLWTDRGKEFYNKLMEKFCADHNITLYSTYGESKSVIAERFNRTLKGWIQIRMTKDNTFNWSEELDTMIDQYNHRKHSTIKITPIEAQSPDSFWKVYMALYGPDMWPEDDQPSKPLKVGNYVRVSRLKDVFEKGYDANWSWEVFKISKVNATRPLTYSIVDWHDAPIEGSFYRRELQKVAIDPMEVFRIESVIKRDNKNKRAFVKWLGWPKKFNSWVPLDDVKDI